jgi:hypothetical protein
VGGLAEGITFEDLVEVRAPKPTLLTFTSRDEYLSIQGAREAYWEAKKAYQAFGQEDHLQLVEDDFKHWLTPKIRKAIYAFFMKHLGVSGDSTEEHVEIIPEEELLVTPTGQLSTYLEAENVFSMNKKEAESLIERLERAREAMEDHLAKVQTEAQKISGYRRPVGANVDPLFNGRYQRDGYSVGKYAIRGEEEYRIPLLLFVPEGSQERYPALLYLHPEGKAAEASPGGEIELLVKKGYVVAAPDILGIGETENTATRVIADDYTAVLIGRSIPGIQAGDIARVVNYLKLLEEVDSARIGAVGIENMGIPLMHAAAFETSIASLILIGSPISYRAIVTNELYRIGLIEREGGDYWHPHEVDFAWGVAGALKAYDLPDLIACVAPRPVTLVGLRDHQMEPASKELVDRDMSFPRAVYARKDASENLRILSSKKAFRSLTGP